MSLRDAKPSDSAIIREQLPEIEAALARGVTRQQVLDILTKDHGLTLKLRGFDAALLRARKARGDQPSPTPPPVVHTVQAPPAATVQQANKPDETPELDEKPVDPKAAAKAAAAKYRARASSEYD